MSERYFARIILAQLAGAAATTLLFRWLVLCCPKDAAFVVVYHPAQTEITCDG